MKRLQVIVMVFFIFVLPSYLHGQQKHAISRYDDEVVRNISIPDLIKNFENALNVISYSGAEPMDFKTIKGRLLRNTDGYRIFFDENVILENDLHYDDWSSRSHEDVDIRRYLENFNLLYPKTQDPTVAFSIVGISSLKKNTYFYYNVLYESKFSNKDMNDNPFSTVRRIAEVRLGFDTSWVAYINGIRFTSDGFDVNDVKNNFNEFADSKGKGLDSKYTMLAQRKAQQAGKQREIAALLTQGDKLLSADDFFGAMDSFKNARLLDPYNDEVRIKINTCDAAIEASKQKKNQAIERLKRQKSMKAVVWKAYNDRDFSVCKLYFDSLTINYGEEMDDTLRTVSSGLQSIAPFISRVNYFERQMEYELALEYTTKVIRDKEKRGAAPDSVLLAEAYYSSGRLFYAIDSMETSDVIAFCEVALKLSNNRHKPARQLLVYSKLNSKRNQFQALDIATALVNADPRNADIRTLRGYVYSRLKDPENAIKDYQLAIDLGSSDSATYINKASLEYSLKNFNACITTTTSGLVIFPCNLQLYYFRILSQEEMGLMNTAGAEFQKALVCGMNGALKDTVLSHGARYFNRGKSFLESGRLDSALLSFSRSFELCRNPDALYNRGSVSFHKGDYKSALADFNRLVMLDSTYPNAYYNRGLVKAAMDDHASAIQDYRLELTRQPANSNALAAYGNSALAFDQYEEAASLFEKSIAITYSDSIGVLALKAYFLAGIHSKVIALANKYISSNKSDATALLKYRGMSAYCKGKYKEAESDLIAALKSMPDDYDVNHYLSMNYLVRGDAIKALKHADRAALACNDCAEALVWGSISNLFQERLTTDQLTRIIDKFALAFRKDSSCYNASNQAWLGYAYLLAGDVSGKSNPILKRAQSLAPDDAVVLFVQAVSLAAVSSDCDVILEAVSRSCSSGFLYKALLDGDPSLKRCRGELEYRRIMDRFFRN